MLSTIRLAGVAALAACVLYAAPVAVQAAEEIPEVQAPTITGKSTAGMPYRVVQIADLNLLHPAGMRTAQNRIQDAARIVCSEPKLMELRLFKAAKNCYDAAFSDAMGQLDAAVASVRVAAR